ncbi:hypothetical protein QJS10_CPB04g01286 [Acorus calamus]|uniref:Uncharacterized protein n=1 Tax=Acorus calamus TaxID=4465 RepID=A0AAV9EZI6_ACOCL|nr:hypothetical protein QJS10_CPB04g01286 [Acorus calamus]
MSSSDHAPPARGGDPHLLLRARVRAVRVTGNGFKQGEFECELKLLVTCIYLGEPEEAAVA